MELRVNSLPDLVRLLENHPEWQLQLARLLFSKQNVQELLLKDPELRYMLRGLIVGEELAQVPAQMQHLTQITHQALQRLERVEGSVEELKATAEETRATTEELKATTEGLKATTERQGAAIEELKTTVEKQGATIEELKTTVEKQGATIEELKTTTERLEATTEELKATTARIEARQLGEEGRRRGEEFERRIVRQAWRLFNGGEGGTPDEPHVRSRLSQWLAGRFDPAQRLKDEDDPLLADLIWWKGDHAAIAEVSLKVDSEDVRRAQLRAATLRQAGVDTLPVVIGEEWATPELRTRAEQEGVAWKIGDEFDTRLIDFRRLAV
ncbi:MAG: hypothetical protein NZ874_09520 [Fimbriimonadales bacterium]|nr:hypothetical protein [Fimbriimonadales bacterium]